MLLQQVSWAVYCHGPPLPPKTCSLPSTWIAETADQRVCKFETLDKALSAVPWQPGMVVAHLQAHMTHVVMVWIFKIEPNEDEALSPSAVPRDVFKSLPSPRTRTLSSRANTVSGSSQCESVRMMFTPEKEAEYEELRRQRQRMLTQCYTNCEIPMDAEHGKWIEFRKQWEKFVKSLPPGAVPGNEQAAGHALSPPLTSPLGWPRPTISNQVPNTMMELLLGAAAHVSSKSLSLPRALSGTDSSRTPRLPRPPRLYHTHARR